MSDPEYVICDARGCVLRGKKHWSGRHQWSITYQNINWFPEEPDDSPIPTPLDRLLEMQGGPKR